MTSTTGASGARRPYARRMPLPERREQLLDSALTVINRDGYRAVNMEAVAREAGVTKPVVYGAFENLGALLGTLLDRQQERALTTGLLAALPNDPGLTVEEYIERTIRAWVDTVRADPATWGPVLLARGGTPDVVWERIDQGRERVRVQLATLLKAAGVTGDGGVDPDVLSHALIAMGYHFGQLLLTEPERVDVDRLVSTVQALVDSAVRG